MRKKTERKEKRWAEYLQDKSDNEKNDAVDASSYSQCDYRVKKSQKILIKRFFWPIPFGLLPDGKKLKSGERLNKITK